MRTKINLNFKRIVIYSIEHLFLKSEFAIFRQLIRSSIELKLAAFSDSREFYIFDFSSVRTHAETR
ncbi:hypothetical protein CKA32_005088 [Geitlerinema sp. FC II]|nr:hypothetical protein CKA32_005088 [Geitlerinema sp. FC II]